MLNLFKSKPLVDETSRQWLFDSFAWALENFDGDFFANESLLILPTNAYFPTRAQSIEELAFSVFERVKEFCGLKHWPFTLVEPQNYVPQNYQLRQPIEVVRSNEANLPSIAGALQNPTDQLPISYDPVQINQPQVMVANYAAMLSSYLIGMSNQLPPGGEDYRLPGIEILAIYMGFGVMFANTAYAFRGSCGSCHNHAANRTAVLSENEAIYALALFGQLKQVPAKDITPHLKKHLRSMYKQAVKQLNDYPEEMERLQLLTRKAQPQLN